MFRLILAVAEDFVITQFRLPKWVFRESFIQLFDRRFL